MVLAIPNDGLGGRHLMVPPASEITIYTGAPLSQWSQVAAFDTATQFDGFARAIRNPTQEWEHRQMQWFVHHRLRLSVQTSLQCTLASLCLQKTIGGSSAIERLF
jgi:hypothetical protein